MGLQGTCYLSFYVACGGTLSAVWSAGGRACGNGFREAQSLWASCVSDVMRAGAVLCGEGVRVEGAGAESDARPRASGSSGAGALAAEHRGGGARVQEWVHEGV